MGRMGGVQKLTRDGRKSILEFSKLIIVTPSQTHPSRLAPLGRTLLPTLLEGKHDHSVVHSADRNADFFVVNVYR